MRIAISQIYIQPNVSYPFNHRFQRFMSKELTELSIFTNQFDVKYGPDWNVIIRVSAKADLTSTDLRGPTVSKRKQEVEYTAFLPFPMEDADGNTDLKRVLSTLIDAIVEVLTRLGIDASNIQRSQTRMVEIVVADSSMVGDR